MERGDDLCDPVALRQTGELKFKVLSDLSEIREISHEWDRLLAASQCNRAFGSPEWFIASCRLTSPSVPYVVTAVLGEEIVGILPLVLDREDGVASFAHRLNDYNDLIVRGDSPSLAAALMSHAASFQGRCKKVALTKLRQDSSCVKALPLIAADPNVRFTSRIINEYRFIDLPHTFDEYLASRSKAFRKGLRRARRAIENDHLSISEMQPGGVDPRLLSELSISLAIARQKEQSLFRQATVQEFVREVLPPVFLKRGLRAFAILQGERVMALDLCVVSGKGLGAWNGGFLPEAERWSLGKILFAFGIEQSINMRFEEYDFMMGQEAYKESWADNRYTVHEVQLVPGA